MNRTIVVRVPCATESNAAWRLLGAEFNLFADGVPVRAKRMDRASHAFVLGPDVRDVLLRVTVPSYPGIRSCPLTIEQSFVADDMALVAVRNSSRSMGPLLHPRLSVEPASHDTLAFIDVDLKVLEITQAVLSRASSVSVVLPPRSMRAKASGSVDFSAVRLYESTSGQSRAWLAVGPLSAGGLTHSDRWLALFRATPDPFVDALRCPLDTIEPYFGHGGVPWPGEFDFHQIALRAGSCRMSPLGETPTRWSSRALVLTVVPLPETGSPFGSEALWDRPEAILKSMLSALWADSVITSLDAALPSTDPMVRDMARDVLDVTVAWAKQAGAWPRPAISEDAARAASTYSTRVARGRISRRRTS